MYGLVNHVWHNLVNHAWFICSYKVVDVKEGNKKALIFDDKVYPSSCLFSNVVDYFESETKSEIVDDTHEHLSCHFTIPNLRDPNLVHTYIFKP